MWPGVLGGGQITGYAMILNDFEARGMIILWSLYY